MFGRLNWQVMKRPFNRPRSKSDLRSDLSRDVAAFLSKGGTIAEHAPGETALEARVAPLHTPLFSEPKGERTPVDDVVAALEERRRQRFKRPVGRRRERKPTPRKKIIYDDFGEALRTVWQDD